MDEINVLYLSYDGMTDPLGQSQVLPYLRELAKQNYKIHLVSYEKKDRYNKYRKHIDEYCEDAGIVWHPQDYVLGGGILTTIRQVRRMRNIAFYLDDKYGFQIVHCRSYIAALAGLRLKRRRGTKFIFDMRGFWADERVDGKLWNLSNPLYKVIYKYFKKKELAFFKESDYTISLTEAGKKEICSWNSLKNNPPKIEVIPCCVDLSLFDPSKINEQQENELRTSLGISKEDYVLGYVGSIGTWYMLDEMLDYFKVLKTQVPHAKFLFVTGEDPNSILKVATQKNIDKNDIVITSVIHKDVPVHITLFNKSIFFIRSTYSKLASSPTKQGEIMAMGVPLVCNTGVGDTDSIVINYASGEVISDFSEDDYLSAIQSQKTYLPENIAKGAKEYFALEEGVKRYLSVYKAIHG